MPQKHTTLYEIEILQNETCSSGFCVLFFFPSKLLPNFTLCNMTYFGLACVVVKVSFVAFSARGWLLSPLQTARLKAEAVLVSQ